MHTYSRGDVITVFEMSQTRGLELVGSATIVRRIGDADEHYVVRFKSDEGDYLTLLHCPTYERFVDIAGQTDPKGYVLSFNRRLFNKQVEAVS